MKKCRFLKLLSIFLILGIFTSCGQQAPTWQEQYDLGVRYLEEGNYEEAIIAFTAAIEIDPKQAPVYVGRGDAYVGIMQVEETIDSQAAEFTSAETDYLTAIDIDSVMTETYIKLADLYLAVGDVDNAIAILERGYQATGDETLNHRRQELGIASFDEVIWTDAVFEQLIREQIGITSGPVYAQNLDWIDSLSIYGDTFVIINDDESESEYWWRNIIHDGYDENHGTLTAYYGYGDNGIGYTTRGNIRNVDTLRYFRNLTDVSIIANHITDVSVLRQMGKLRNVNFWANDIVDISPITELTNYYADNNEQFIEIGDTLTIS